jgi:hypothetical protein
VETRRFAGFNMNSDTACWLVIEFNGSIYAGNNYSLLLCFAAI